MIANVIVFYNSAILWCLLTTYKARANEITPALISPTSPVDWQQVHLNGRYAFRDGGVV